MKNDIDTLFSAYISDEDVKKFEERTHQKTLQYNAGFLIRGLYGWILAEDISKIKEYSAKVLKDPILSKNQELLKRIENGLSKKDLTFLKSLF